MRKYLHTLTWLGLIALMALIRANAEEVPQILDLGTKDVSVFLAVPDLNGFIKHVESVAAEFAPGQVQGGMVKAQLGVALGDPALDSLDLTKPIVLFVLNAPPAVPGTQPAPPPIALFIPAKAAAPIQQVLQTQMKLATAFQDGLLIASKTDADLTKAKALTGAYQKIAAAGIKADARIFANVSNLLASYGDVIKNSFELIQKQMALAQPPPNAGKMDPAALAKLVGLEMKVVMGMLQQSESAQYDVNIKADAILANYVYAAKNGTPVGALFSSPNAGKCVSLDMLTADKSVMALSMKLDKAAYTKFVLSILDAAEKDPDFAEFGAGDLITAARSNVDMFGSDIAFTMVPTPENPIGIQVSTTISDPDKYIAFIDSMLKSDAITKFYEKLGMTMTMGLEKNVREHAGLKINRIKMAMDMKNMPPEQAAQMKTMVKDTEFTFVKNQYLASNTPETLDKLIDHALLPDEQKTPVELQAMKVFGAGNAIYADYNFVGLLKSIFANPAILKLNPMLGVFAGLKGGEPITIAMTYSNARVLSQVRIPLGPFIEIANLVRGLAPQAPPPPKDEKF